MGFKRSNEGRVFFQTLAEETHKQQAQQPKKPAQTAMSSENKLVKKDATQMQILTLLKALNARLQASQQDKETLQKEIEDAKKQLEQMQLRATAQETKAKALERALNEKGSGNAAEVRKAEALAQDAMAELKETRKLLLEIEDRAGRNEVALRQHEGKLRESEERVMQQSTQLLKKAGLGSQDLEKRLKIAEQVARENERDLDKRLTMAEKAQNQIDKRLEDVLVNNEKLDRKIEQAIQERSRLIRKLERIEETVLATNDAMNARAMVLLTDQATAAGSRHPQIPANMSQSAPMPDANVEEDTGAWWQRKWKMDAFSATTAMVVVLLLGWGINEIQRPESTRFDLAQWGESLSQVDVVQRAERPVFEAQSAQKAQQAALQPAQDDESFVERILAQDETPIETEDLADVNNADAVTEATEAAVSDASTPATKNIDGMEVLDVNDSEALEELLAEDPQKLGRILNDIEPSSVKPSGVKAEAQNGDVADTIAKEMTPSQLSEADLSTPQSFELPEAPSKPLSERIRVDQSLPEGVFQIQTDAFAGSAEAQHDLAAIYTAGHGGVKQDYRKAAQWFEEAAHNGVANAQYNLGVMFHQGIGLEKDTETAFRWYHAAAEQGHAEAQYNLGIAYIEGIGVPYDALRAAGYFERAARAGVMEAAYNLGLIYENGLLGDTMPDKALVWYKTASDQGSPEAKAALEMLAKNLGVSLDDVNRIVDNMKVIEEGRVESQEPVTTSSVAAPETVSVDSIDSYMPPMDDTTFLIAEVQKQLMERGLYPGPADGINGMLTRDAIRSYQNSAGIDVDGEVSDALLTHMINGGSAEQAQGGSIIFQDAGDLGSRD